MSVSPPAPNVNPANFTPGPAVTPTAPASPSASDSSVPPANSTASSGAGEKQYIVLDDIQESLQELWQQTSDSTYFLRLALRLLAQQHEALCMGLRARTGATSVADFAALPQFEGTGKAELQTQVDATLQACLGETKAFLVGPQTVCNAQVYFVALGFDLARTCDLVGTALFAIAANTQAELDLKRVELQSAFTQVLQCITAHALENSKTQTPERSAADTELDLAARTSRYGSTREFAFALVNSMARRFECQQVAFGITKGTSIQLQAISGKDHFKASSPGMVDIQQAMEESLDAARTVSYQPHGLTEKHHPRPVHQQWSASTNCAVCSLPLLVDDDCIAVVSLTRDIETGFSDEDLIAIEQTVAPLSPAVEMAIRGDRTLTEHVKQSCISIWTQVRHPQSNVGKRARFLAIFVACIFLFGWAPHRPTSPCAVVPAGMTQELTPFDMRLVEAPVRSGDRVRAGQVIAAFDTRELELERGRLESQREQSEVDVRAALVAGDVATASMAKANAAVYDTQLQTVLEKIQRCTVRATQDGMIVQAELDRRVGQIFPQGEKILAFAPMDSFELELHVPEHQARRIEAGQTGAFASSAGPGYDFDYTIESVSGSAEMINGVNVFVARAKLDGRAESLHLLRQGMEGYGKTEIGWRPIPWIVFHRVFNYARSCFWL
ncbi:MAG: efflux RND transporter periplasmic adaptor subunit [Pirellulaceae bacterium]